MKSPLIPTHSVLANQFDNFDAFAEAGRGWDVDFRQMDRGRFRADLTHIVTPSVILAECALSRKVEQRGAPPTGFRTFGIPAADVFDVWWRGQRVGSEHLLLFPQGGELESVSLPGFHVFAFSVSEQRMVEAARRRGLASVEELFPGCEVMRCPPRTLSRLRGLAASLSESAGNSPGLLEDRAFRESLEYDLVESLLDVLGESDEIVGSRPMAKSRGRALRKALEVIADRANEPIMVSEVERLSGASGRTLRYAFQEAYGLSPKQYLQHYRLDRVHRQLLRGGEGVSDVANSWGFWHLGQFAKDYRQKFGETPSKTLSRHC